MIRCSFLENVGASLLCLLLLPFKKSKLDRPSAEIASRPDILCIHGYLHNEMPWFFYRRQLQKAGFGPVNGLRYHSIRWDIPRNSRLVHEKILEIKRATGKEVRILIGHSLGGVACLEYALEYANKKEIIYIITLGSPLHGTTIARFGLGPSVRQIEIGSAYLANLHARLAKASHIRILALSGSADYNIRPPESAHLPELSYATNETIADLSHNSFLFSRRAINRIMVFLKVARL